MGMAGADLAAGVVHVEAREEALHDGLADNLEHGADERLAGDDGRQRGDDKARPEGARRQRLPEHGVVRVRVRQQVGALRQDWTPD